MKFKDEDFEGQQTTDCEPEGDFVCEVTDVTPKTTTKGDEMWSLKFKNCATGDTICYDNLVFSPKARKIAFTKLKGLGVEKDADGNYDIEPDDLIGYRAKLSLWQEKYTDKQGRERLRLNPDIYAEKPFECGYQTVKENEKDDIPF